MNSDQVSKMNITLLQALQFKSHPNTIFQMT